MEKRKFSLDVNTEACHSACACREKNEKELLGAAKYRVSISLSLRHEDHDRADERLKAAIEMIED